MMDQKHEEPKFYLILNYGDRGSRTCLTVAVRSLPSAENLFVVNKVRFDVRFWLPCGSSKDGSGRWGRHCWRCFLRWSWQHRWLVRHFSWFFLTSNMVRYLRNDFFSVGCVFSLFSPARWNSWLDVMPVSSQTSVVLVVYYPVGVGVIIFLVNVSWSPLRCTVFCVPDLLSLDILFYGTGGLQMCCSLLSQSGLLLIC